MFEDIELDDIKSLALTKSEALYLSENITVLMEFGAGKYQAPGRPLFASARVAVPLEIIQKIGFAVLVTTQREDAETEVSVEFTVAELLILRECCDSRYDAGGESLTRKIYSLILEKEFSEMKLVESLTKGVF